jgi:hypothetical protein
LEKGRWYLVESKTASIMMSYLAAVDVAIGVFKGDVVSFVGTIIGGAYEVGK